MTKEALIEELLLTNYDKYYRLAMSYTHNHDDAMDIVQNGAYKAIRGSHKIKQQNYAQTWLYRIMLNEIFRFCQSNPKVLFVPDEKIPEQGAEDSYENFDLKVALDSLPAKDKTIVILKYFEDMKLSEIAEILQEKESTVKSRLYRSLEKLKLKLDA